MAGRAAGEETGTAWQNAVRSSVYHPEVSKFPVSELAEDQLNDESRELGFYLQKGCSKSTHGLVAVTVTISRRSMTTTKRAVCAGRW
ncbi:hypothetical protein SE957_13410 [Escherichia coli]|nr:hypothetical protein [Escherichia coli]